MIFLRRFSLPLAILAATAATALQMFAAPLPTPIFDARGYLTVAVNLNEHDVFSRTYAAPSSSPPPADMFFAPLYPAFLFAAAKLSPGFSEYASCVVHARGLAPEDVETLCPHRIDIAIVLQCTLAVLSTVLVYIGAFLICERRRYAWIAMGLAIASGEYAYYAELYLTENLVFPLFTAFSIVLILALRNRSAWMWAATGATLGLLVLVRPSFLYLTFFVFLFPIAVSILRSRNFDRDGVGGLAACGAGFCFFVLPWILRNWLVHGIPSVTDGYASFILVQRIAYNAMTTDEWLVSWLYWVPDFGEKFAAYLLPPEFYARLRWDDVPISFYMIGNTTLREETLQASGGLSNHLDYLLKEYVFAEFGKHILVTLPLAWRGGGVAILCFAPALICASKKQRRELAVFSLPAWFMLGFHAFVSVNVSRYNMIMIPGLTIGAAIMAVLIFDRLRTVGARAAGVASDKGDCRSGS